MADDTLADAIAEHRRLYLAAYFAGHEGEADFHLRVVDELLHCGGHYDRDLHSVLDDLARWQP